MESDSIAQFGLAAASGATFGGVAFILIMSLVREPARRNFNAIFVAGAGAAYLGSGLWPWEFAFIAVMTFCAYRGLDSYRFIGIAWLLHTSWDVVHHVAGQPIWSFDPLSSAGCAGLDAVIGLWFLAGAPSVYARWLPSLSRDSDAQVESFRA